MHNAAPTITVEFFGLPRRLAERKELAVSAATVRDALQAVIRACPGLGELLSGDHVSARYLISLDGKRFMSDVNETLEIGAHVLILGADAGG